MLAGTQLYDKIKAIEKYIKLNIIGTLEWKILINGITDLTLHE